MDTPVSEQNLPGGIPEPADLWEEYLPRLVVFVRAHGGAAALAAEDVAQDIVERAIRNSRRFDGNYAFSTWVYRLARNYCIDVGRRASRRRAIRERNIRTIESLHRRAPGPEETLARNEEAGVVARAIGRLEPADRQLAFLRFFEELPLASIAEVLGMPVGTVKYRLHELVGRLRLALEEEAR